MIEINLLFAWCWMTLGLLSGAAQGLGFHRESWMGGYNSWRRRLTRLGHIAFFGTGMLNLGMALTADRVGLIDAAVFGPGVCLIVGAVSMSLVCYLSAWRKPLRNLFFVPVLSLTVGCGWFVVVLFRHHFLNGVL
jgi:hypothetical protein